MYRIDYNDSWWMIGTNIRIFCVALATAFCVFKCNEMDSDATAPVIPRHDKSFECRYEDHERNNDSTLMVTNCKQIVINSNHNMVYKFGHLFKLRLVSI